MTDQSLSDRVLAGDPRAIARAISLIEDETPQGADLVRRVFPRTGRAYLIGVTGPPGAGKSTLVDRMTQEMRGAERTVGVVAVDPTSPFTGGAILGDRVRMLRAFAGGRLEGITWRRALLAIVLTTIYGASDEFHQRFTPGRTPDLLDLRADAIGACGGVLAGFLARVFRSFWARADTATQK